MDLQEFTKKVKHMKEIERDTFQLVQEVPIRAFPILMTQLLQISERIIAIEQKLNIIGTRNFPADWRAD